MSPPSIWAIAATTLLLVNLMGGSCSSPIGGPPITEDNDDQVLDDQPDPSGSDPNGTDNPSATSPQLTILASVSAGPAPLEVTFTAQTLDGQALPEGTYNWDFGDATTDTGQQVTHTYSTAAICTVTLSFTPSSTHFQPATATTTVSVSEQLSGVSAEYELTEDEPFQFTLGASATDVKARFSLVTLPISGTLDVPGSGDLASPVLTYTPAAGFVGEDSLAFSVSAETTVAAKSVRCWPATVKFCVRRKGILAVSPETNLIADGHAGGPFTPAEATYTLTNVGKRPLDWKAARSQTWVALSKTSGTLAAGATETVTVSFTAEANALAEGSYSDTVSFINKTNGRGNATRIVRLTVGSTPGTLSVSPSANLTSSGVQGGPFSPASKTYTLTNTGGQSLNWTAAKTQNWLSLSTSSGTLAAGATATVTVSITSAANGLAPATYTDTLTFTNTTNASGNTTRGVSLTVNAPAGVLSVSPSANLASSGVQGGPFSPAGKDYTLTNTGGQSLNWTAAKTQTWLDLSKTSGTLAAGASVTVTASIAGAANSLAVGSYTDTITFTNTTNAASNTTRSVSLTVNPAAGALSVSPSANFSSSGCQGGPFSPSSKTYTLTNTGGQSINWTASKNKSWLSLSKTSGTLAAGATSSVTVSIASGANNLAVGNYSGTVTFTNTTNGSGNTTRSVSLTVTAASGTLSVSPSTGLTSSGTQGGPFSPASATYTLTNTGGQSLNWTADKTQTWVALSKTSGTLAAGASDTVTVSIAAAANSLAVGSYTDTVTFTNTTNGSGNTTRAVSLTVNPPPGALAVSPTTGLTSSGTQGGPFSPVSATYTLTNTGGQSLNWTAAKTQTWVTLSKTSGILAAGASDTVTVSIATAANSLAVGSYTDTVTFTNTTNGSGNTTRAVSLTVAAGPGVLSVTPSTGLTSSGTQGGPFSPSSAAYTLTNTGGQPLNWTAAKTQTWVGLSKTSGTLAAGASDTVTVSIATAANSLTAGNYSDTVTFTNTTNGSGNATRTVALTVNAPPGALSVTPSTGLSSSGNQGGPFSPSSAAYTLTNTGGQSITWTATKTQPWVGLSKASGTLPAGASDTLTVSIATAANNLAAGSYSDAVTLTNTTNGAGNTTRSVALAVNALPGVLSVTPTGGLTSSGTQGGPFTPPSATYTLANTGGLPVNWTAAKTQTWVSLSKTSGTLAAGATDTVVVSIGSTANSLTTGSYSDTVTFTNATNGSGNATRAVALTVNAPPGALSVSPITGLVSDGNQGGPFNPASATYTLTNTGGQFIAWSATKTQSWLSLSNTGGGLAPGASDTVVVSFAASANSLAVNTYTDTVTFTNTTNGAGNTTRSVSLTVHNPPGALNVTPTAGLNATGPVGGTFSPASVMYTLTNNGGSPITWTAAKTANWLSLSQTSGTLEAGASTTTVLYINLNANALPAGTYTDSVVFTNTTNGAGNTTRAVTLTITSVGDPMTSAAGYPTGYLALTPAHRWVGTRSSLAIDDDAEWVRFEAGSDRNRPRRGRERGLKWLRCAFFNGSGQASGVRT